jgi:fatty-acyl-CoA synthase
MRRNLVARNLVPLADSLSEASRLHGSKTAILHGERHLTYSELKEEVDRFARGLMSAGIGRGDPVIVWMPNSIEWNIVFPALAKIGAITVPVSTRYRSYEMEYIIGRSDAVALIMTGDSLDIPFLDMIAEMVPEAASSAPGNIRSERFPCLRNLIIAGEEGLAGSYSMEDIHGAASATRSEDLAERNSQVAFEDAFMMLFTSGTTGRPKGCLIPQSAFCYHAATYASVLGWSEEDVALVIMPYFHIFGTQGHMAPSFLRGSRQIIMDAFDAGEALRLIQQEKVTLFSGAPTLFISCLNHPDFSVAAVSTLRLGAMGGSPCPPEIMQRVMDSEEGMGMDIRVVYGLSEASGTVSLTEKDDALERRVSTVGKPVPGLEVKVVDTTKGSELRPGEQGELWVRSPYNMIGYYRDPEATAQRLGAGWLHTNDLAVLDEDGYISITGRLSDMILVGGFNTYPTEIEQFLYTHPKVHDVSIIGVPDERMGEVVMAYIIPKEGTDPTAAEIVDFCQGKLANFKIPRYVEFVDSFPLTGSGKVQKFIQRKMAAEKLANPSGVA